MLHSIPRNSSLALHKLLYKREGHSKDSESEWRRVMVSWASYLHEEEEQDGYKDADFRMDPGSRFP